MFPSIPDLCKCGCKEIVWNGKIYKSGHNRKGIHQTQEAKYKISIAQKGKSGLKGDLNPSKRPEVREKISKIKKGKRRPDMMGNNNPAKRPEVREKLSGKNNHFYGKHHLNESKDKISKANKGKLAGNKNPRYGKCGEENPNWNGGTSFLPYCSKFNNQKKEEIRNKYHRKCYNCGKDEKDNITKSSNKRLKLYVHHIDFDKMQGCNGKSWKLIPLCMSCHNKLHHNKIKLELKNCV